MDNDAPLPSDNRLIATAVRTSLRGQTILSSSKSTFYKAVGVGAFLSLLGIGTGLAFYGYSRVSGASTNLETITSAITRSLQSTKLNVVSTGQVALTNAQVAVKDGQSVSLEPGAKVAVLQKEPFKVEGSVKVEAAAPGQGSTASSQNAQAKILTNFTVFKSVPFGEGVVVTGWNFFTSEQAEPSLQYCYYTKKLSDDTSGSIFIATDRVPLQQTTIRHFDAQSALDKCVWFETKEKKT